MIRETFTTERTATRGAHGTARRTAAWAAGITRATAALVALPLVVMDRLPDRLATHWSGSTPDDSMSPPAAAAFPALLWAAAALLTAIVVRRRGPGTTPRTNACCSGGSDALRPIENGLQGKVNRLVRGVALSCPGMFESD
ncbi:DUF1648 domain-containing protein [Streptomyces sp. BI20]|uniref:DUF1648 domain-containing protein n=1 Tax=Streptomyces sp. BI20 TaxID=3403460 RepID=UPI003C709F2E